MTDRQLIEIGAQELAARHGFPDLSAMRQRDFEYLCARIEESSGILISLSTIKRILNGQYNRLPQVATLNAISVYLGYPDWQAFRAAKQNGAARQPLRPAASVPDPTSAGSGRDPVLTGSAPGATPAGSGRAPFLTSPTPDATPVGSASDPIPAGPAPDATPAVSAPCPNPSGVTSATKPTPAPQAVDRATASIASAPVGSAPHPNPARSAPHTHRRVSYPLIAAGIILLALLSWNYFSSSSNSVTNATFGIRRTTQNTVPNTVVFTYDVDHVPGDSFFIQQSWDRHRRVRIEKGSHTLTDIYYEPGYHTAKLIANDKIIKTLGVSIPTDGWFFYSKESLSRGLPSYIHTATPIRKDILGLDKQDLVNNRIDPDKPQVFLYTWFPTEIGTSADNFRLNAKIRMTEVRNTACPFIMPEIFCQKGLMYFVLTMPGCTGAGGEINAQFGNHFLDGRSTDLSPLAVDIHSWHNIEMVVEQQQVTIAIDGKAVLTSSYPASAGLITGLGFHSNGLSAVDSIRLTGLNGKTVYPATH